MLFGKELIWLCRTFCPFCKELIYNIGLTYSHNLLKYLKTMWESEHLVRMIFAERYKLWVTYVLHGLSFFKMFVRLFYIVKMFVRLFYIVLSLSSIAQSAAYTVQLDQFLSELRIVTEEWQKHCGERRKCLLS